MSLGTTATNGPSVPNLDDKWMTIIDDMITGKGKSCLDRRT
jgi:hypothetical protein